MGWRRAVVPTFGGESVPRGTDTVAPSTRVTRPGRGWLPTVLHNGDVGFNPHRPQRRSPADIVFVVGALAVALALLLWALLG